MRLPQKLPGSFSLAKGDKDVTNDDLRITYTFDVYVEGLRFELCAETEIQVRQFLFTEDEIEDDLKYQKVIIQFQKMLNPGEASTLNTNNLDKEEIMNYVKEHKLFENVML